jgi:GNAT superfamily N-acetyltransferase
VEIRRTTPDDLPATYDVFRTAIGELFRRHAFDPPGAPLEVFAAQHGHLLEHDAERCLVADDGGRVVGFAAALARGDDAWFLASMFIRPEHQGRGLGRRLLAGVWGGDHARRFTLTDSIQPVSNGLYASRGLVPATPALRFTGTPARPTKTALEPVEPDDGAFALLDLAGYGFDRELDHRFWRHDGAATLWLRSGEPVAYSYVFPGGRIGPVAAVDGPTAAEAVAAELARRDGEVGLIVPGTCSEVVLACVAAGLRLSGPPGLLLLAAGTPLPRALVPSGFTLF